MTAVTVFVDEAVRGDFPPVCARTGRPTDDLAWFERPVSGRNWALLLLLLLGPPGWLVLVVLLATDRRETLTVRLPYSPEAWAADRRLRARSLGTFAAGAAAVLAGYGFTGTGPAGVWFVIGMGLVVGGAALAWARRAADPSFSLDASRRWVTVTNVHPAFVEATLARPVAVSPGR
ncbi:MAG TPA: hypothetical protein VM390_12470 [Acidimicrobiales bacterium]|jgi:hypothetical protein|nr:hypothetical protein [Acidimicrobiales bacterium]